MPCGADFQSAWDFSPAAGLASAGASAPYLMKGLERRPTTTTTPVAAPLEIQDQRLVHGPR